jgi:hypothetical protein
MWAGWAAAGLTLVPLGWAVGQERADEVRVDFATEIRPLLSDRCYKCHGPDEATREANLRLDLGVGLTTQVAESSDKVILAAGDPAQSELFLRLQADDDQRMPPLDSGLALSAEEIAKIERWIQQGAAWDRHWSFVPLPAQVAVPATEAGAQWVRNPIDAFIDRDLVRQGLQPAPPAPPHALLRRLYLDLIGIPPTPEEVQQWLAYPESQRWEAVVDHLLGRPEYGQRMATEWLDVARYSDTYGYQVDRERFVWPWRDWVVQAFNDNLPFDRFGTLQIAGDLLPNATFDEILPTTFGRLHPQEVEGGSVEEEYRMKYISDRTETYGMAFLGMTLECCRCHHHKYDPISQEDYYRLTAYFDNIDEAGLYSYFTDSVPTPTAWIPDGAAEQEAERLRQQIQQKEQQIAAGVAQIRSQQPWRDRQGTDHAAADAWPGQLAHLTYGPTTQWPAQSENRLVPFAVTGSAEPEAARMAVELSGDEAVNLDVGNFRRWQPFSLSLWLWAPRPMSRAVVLHRSRAWTDAGSRGYELLIEDGRLKFSLIHFWPGNAVSVRAAVPLEIQQWVPVTVTYDGSSRAGGLRIFLNGQAVEVDVVRDGLTKQITGGGGDHIAIGERFRDQGFTGGRVAEVRVFDRQLSSLEAGQLARPDFNVAALGEVRRRGWAEQSAGDGDATESTWPADHLTDEPLAEDWVLNFSADYANLRGELRSLREQLGNVLDRRREIMVMQELPTPRPTYLRERGDYDAPAQLLTPGVPEAIMPWSADYPDNRLGLARWTFDRRNPLTARVAVNRWWQLMFGEGLVRTPEDFGNQGQRPTHADLLDYLAVELIESGWDVKRLLRTMVLSATYQQSVVPDPLAEELDPENRGWSRASAHRWPAETLRDQALAVAGLLDVRMGGPPVKPYDLAEAFAPLPVDAGPQVHRRSLYTYWKRMSPSPVMIVLDAVKRDVCQVKRERTTTPAQSLVFLNAPQFVEAARALAARCWTEHPAPEPALERMFEYLLARRPAASERELLQRLYDSQRERFAADPDALAAYLQVGHYRMADDLPAQQVGALAVVANTLMGLDQWTTRR